MLRTIVLELDEDDYNTIQNEIARRQAQRDDKGMYTIPEGDSNIPGAVLAECVRGFRELLNIPD